MNILLTIHHDLDPHSGAAGSVLALGRAYQQLGHEVTYYAFNDLPSWVPDKATGVLFPELLAAHVLSQHAKRPFDVIDASTGDAWVWGTWLQHFAKSRPLLVTRSHGLEHAVHLQNLEDAARGQLHLSWKYPLYWGGFRLWEVARSLRCADLVFLLNRQDLKYATERLGVHPDRANVCLNGISDALLNLPFEPASPDAPRIGIALIGTYILRKGIQYSVPALNAVLRRYPQVFVSFLGTGCSEEQVHKDFEPIVRDRVQVIPRFDQAKLPSLLKGHQIKLFAPLCEGFGKALVEAMACGLAPVTTAAAGPLEVVQDGQDAIVVPLRDSQAIERAIARLIDNSAERARIQQNAHQTAQKYNWMRFAQARLTLYKAALDKKRQMIVHPT